MITSASNGRIKTLIQWNKKAKARKEADVFLVEGVKMFLEAPAERIQSIYVAESFRSDSAVQSKLQRCSYETVADEVFARISDTQTPQGILCVMRQYHYTMERLCGGERPLLLLLEDIQDPGNLGTMLRAGEGAGIDGVIMTAGTADVYNPKTIRATMGSIYRMPFLYTDNLIQTIERLRRRDIAVYAAHLKAEVCYDKCDYRRAAAFLIGNEGGGLREETAKAADTYLTIPMAGQAESLNAAVAASVLMYEAARQRRNA